MDSAGTIKLRVLREEAILDYVVGPTASVNVLRKGDTKGDFRREPRDRGRGRPGHRAQPRWGGRAHEPREQQLLWTRQELEPSLSHHGPADPVVLTL